jgi:hypothetical protein
MFRSSISFCFARKLARVAAASLLAGIIGTGVAQGGGGNKAPPPKIADPPPPGSDEAQRQFGLGFWLWRAALDSRAGLPIRLGMYAAPGPNVDGWAGAGFSATRNTGYSLTDTAGLLTPGVRAPTFRSVTGGGGIAGTVDFTRYLDLPATQRLVFGAAFDARTGTTRYGTSPDLLAAGIIEAGSLRQDRYTLTLLGGYNIGSLYLTGETAFDWGHGDITNNITNGQGSFDADGYRADVALGNVFTLIGPVGYQNPGMLTKGPRSAPVVSSGLYLDLSGHLGYRQEQDDGFTDSSGFIFGTERVRYGVAGAQARLFATIPSGPLLWTPYVDGRVDQRFGFSHTLFIPNQPASLADVFTFGEAKTFWGTDLGLIVSDRAGLSAGANFFYTASSDTSVVGGRAFLKVPFYASAAR